jgi:phage-related protein
MAKSNFIVRGGADFSGITKGLSGLQKQFNGFQSKISKSMGLVTKVLGGLAIGKLIKDSTSAAMGVESAIDNISRNMGAFSNTFDKFAKTQSKALGLAREEAYKYGSTFSNLLGSFADSTEETAKQTEELMKAAAIIASKTGRSYDDTANRIRSGMLGSTEAIEDLGVYTNVSMIESTKAFKKFAGNKSWSQLSFQQQQQIRLAAILEQTYARYGDTLADTTQTKQARFLATLKNIRLNLGQAFLPIYNVVLPVLTSLGNMLESVTSRLAAFSQALFGKSATQTAKNVEAHAKAMDELGESTEAAGKAAKGALAGFDELNVLQKNEAGGGANAATTTTGGLTTVASEQGQTGAIETLATNAEAMANKVKDAFARMKKVIQENKDYIISALAGIATAFASFKVISNWSKIVGAVKLAFIGLTAAMGAISAPALAVAAAIGAIVGVIIYLWRTNEEFRDKVLQIWGKIKSGLSYVATTLMYLLKDLWDNHISGVVAALWGFLGKLLELVAVVYNNVILPLISYLIDKLGPAWKKVFDGIVAVVKYVVPIIADVIKGIIRAAQGVIDFLVGVFTGDWKKAWEGIKDIFGGIVDGIVALFKGGVNLIIAGINRVIEAWNALEFKVPEVSIMGKTFGGFSIGTIKIPPITPLAKGGLVSDTTLAMIGEAGKEAVLPLENNTGWMDQLAERLSTEVTISFNGDLAVLARVLNPVITKEQKRRGTSLVTGNI